MNARRLDLPREHGFWVMLGGVLVGALGRAEFQPWSLVTAAVAATVCILGATIFHRFVRIHPLAQLVSSMGLALVAIPVELVAQVPLSIAIADCLAWASLFLGGALAVRAAFARARRKSDAAPWLTLASCSAPVIAVPFLLLVFSNRPAAGVAALGVLSTAIFALLRPRPKALKRMGLSLAFTVAVAASLFMG